MVRPRGLEPLARGLGNHCSILLSYGRRYLFNYIAKYKFINGTPGGIRTPDLQVRSLSLYPAELRALIMAEREGFEPSRQF